MEPASDEWELCNDDGFIYKRKKRRLAEPSASQLTDPEAEERQRRERKRKALSKLKKHYQKEINQWELLSTTLQAMQGKTQAKSLRNSEETPSFLYSAWNAIEESEMGFGSALNELLLQVEAQAAIIHDVANLCDVAEAMCSAQEEQLKQSFIDLPVWSSPRELMASCLASLCDE
ncbi:uncharacterized protein LOC123224309 [Mangifera indica]|uniref:uncharacterized protein LOC123224309 n=1 Tax=Mangifera indica TaxID=29780 RepID=UPI001CF9B95A|nr:uncharacterized protein LOC123224309 [Mangifera indica]